MGSTRIAIFFALRAGESFPALVPGLLTMVLGFVSYGLSIEFYILAQKDLGAAQTSAFYSIAPFLGVGFSFLILGEQPGLQFYLALVVMAIGTLIMVRDTLSSESLIPGYVHSHAHGHGSTVHTHTHRHAAMNPVHVHLHSHL